MIMRVLAAVVASSVGFALAQGPVNGVVGANNATTPTEKDGNITIHYVTVGEATYNFKVRGVHNTSHKGATDTSCSQTVSMLARATL